MPAWVLIYEALGGRCRCGVARPSHLLRQHMHVCLPSICWIGKSAAEACCARHCQLYIPSRLETCKLCLVTRVGCRQVDRLVKCKLCTSMQITNARCVLRAIEMSGTPSARKWGDLMGNRERGGPVLGDARKAALNCAAFRLGQCYVLEGIATMQKKKGRRWSCLGR